MSAVAWKLQRDAEIGAAATEPPRDNGRKTLKTMAMLAEARQRGRSAGAGAQ